jgi:nucleoside-diphosphate-sugar epimerase
VRFLIAGGAGFVGSHLCEELKDHGDGVVDVLDLWAGHRSSLAYLPGRLGFRIAEIGRYQRFDPTVDDISN